MDQIFITNLRCRGILGVNPDEREKIREIVVNLTLFVDTQRAGKSDDIADTVSYSTIAKKVMAHVESAARFTVEALAADVAQLCLAETGVQKVRVRVDKPGAVRFAESVGVEIERWPAVDSPGVA
jgi:FolB domain-containing protein